MRRIDTALKTTLKTTARRALGLALLLSALALSAASAEAQVDGGMRISLGAWGVAQGQEARLTAVWTRVTPPDPCLPPGPCKSYGPFDAALTFYDADGNAVARRSVQLYQGRAASLDFAPREFGEGGRAQLRAEVVVEPDADGVVPYVIPSAEVFNADGSGSNFLDPGSLVGFNPQPDPPGDRPDPDFEFGFVTQGRGQTARLNASYTGADGELPPGPCRVTLGFYDGDGRLVTQSVETLELGRTVSLDLRAGGLPPDAGGRLRATVHVETLDGRALPRVMPALELFDQDTGKTSLFYPGSVIGG